jgi:GNAT superfamily N-acetyltransferase
MNQASNSFTLAIEDAPSARDVQAVRDGLEAHNRLHAPPNTLVPLTIFVRDADGALAGGLLGGSAWGWLHIDILWVDERARGQGYGQRLIGLAEAEGRRRGCHHVFVDTMSFQALPFYQKLGYAQWGELDDFPIGHKRHFLKKAL